MLSQTSLEQQAKMRSLVSNMIARRTRGALCTSRTLPQLIPGRHHRVTLPSPFCPKTFCHALQEACHLQKDL